MNLPHGYDDGRLAGPDNYGSDCEHCGNSGERECPECGGGGCVHCDDDGALPCDCKEQAADDADGLGDWRYEQSRDREMDNE